MGQIDNNEIAIRRLIETFTEGWNRADSTLLASVFAEDADFTAITGLRARGRAVIASGHNEILSTIYRGTTNTAKVESIHFLRPDVAVVDVKFTLRKPDGNLAIGVPYSIAGVIATQENGAWAIAVFRNMIPFTRPVVVQEAIVTTTA